MTVIVCGPPGLAIGTPFARELEGMLAISGAPVPLGIARVRDLVFNPMQPPPGEGWR